jgi:GNAT superfamily N-acetyltransferase
LPQQSLNLIGFGRCITDFTTFLYLTDVWVDPATQGQGLGKWLISCIREVIESMPYLRRSILFTGDWERSVPFYEKLLKMDLVETTKGKNLALMERKGPGHPSFA